MLQNPAVQKWLEEILPDQIGPARFTRIAMASLRRNPDLLACDPGSFLSALLGAASIGLEVDDSLGRAYLVPFKKECTLIIGYRGYQELAIRSGRVSSFYAEVVRGHGQPNGDIFDWELGTSPSLKHVPRAEPDIKPINAGSGQTFMHVTGKNVTHAYAVAKLTNGETMFVVLTRTELDSIKSRSRASHSGPWVTDPEEMMRKTAIRRLAKRLPLSPEAQRVVAIDEAADTGQEQDFKSLGIDVPSFTPPSATAASPQETVDESTGEIRTDGEGQEVPDAPPKQEDIQEPAQYGRCPLHQKAWVASNYGFWHSTGVRGQSCTPGKVVQGAAAERLGWDSKRVNEELKKIADGATASKLAPDQLQSALQHIDAIAKAETAQGEEAQPEPQPENAETQPSEAAEEAPSEPVEDKLAF